jgi:hypothetical protein
MWEWAVMAGRPFSVNIRIFRDHHLQRDGEADADRHRDAGEGGQHC